MTSVHLLERAPLLSRAGLLAAGHTDTELRRRRRPDGDLVTVGRGLYVERAVWESAAHAGQHQLLTAAAMRLTDDETVVSHGSAAVMCDLRTLRASIRCVHLTRPGATTVKQRSGHRLHGGRLDPDEVVTREGLLVTTPARTVADIARCDGWLGGLVVADQALRAGVTRDQIAAALGRQRGRPGSAVFDRLLMRADAGADNPGETLARALVLEVTDALELPPPETQFLVRDGRTAYADLRVGRLLIEFDGRWKYGRDRPFGDSRPPEEVLWEEKTREDWLRERGYVVIRLIWSDVWGSGRDAALARVRAAVIAHSGLVTAA